MPEAKSSKKKVTIPMTKAKETKGWWMFASTDDTSPVSNVYFSKVGLEKIDSSETVIVTIEVA